MGKKESRQNNKCRIEQINKKPKRAKGKDSIRKEAIKIFTNHLDKKLLVMKEGQIMTMITLIELEDSSCLRETEEYRNWRKNVFERDKICQDCGSDEKLHAHHKIPFQYDPFEKGIDVNNGIILCEKCHRKAHSKKA